MRAFAEAVNLRDTDDVLDIGGRPRIWTYLNVKPWITIANLDAEERREGRLIFRNVDGRKLPFGDKSFDIAFSNSAIEHVGDWGDQRRFANEARRVGHAYYVQTPYRWFFFEPHFLCPFIHWLPRKWMRRLLPFCSVWYWLRRPPPEAIDRLLKSIRLLTVDEMRTLFPDARLEREKFLFFTKSIIVVRPSKHAGD